MSDSTVKVTITGDATPAAAAMQDGVVAAQRLAAALQAVGGDLRKVTPEMLGMAAATNQMSQAAQAATSSMRTTSTAATGLMQSMQRQAQTAFDASRANTAIASTATHAGGAMSGVVREFTVLGREAMVGRFSLIPGSMLVLANRMGVASAAVYGLVAAFAAAAIAGAALYEWIGKINAAKAGAEASAAFYNTDVSQAAIDKMVMKYRELDGVSTENAGKVVATYASMRGANETTIQALINQTQAYADATGSKLPQAAAEIKRAFEAPTEAGLRFLNNINASADAIKKFDAASGDTAVADKRRVMLEALAAATARVGETNSEVAKRQAQDAASAAMMTGGGFAVPGFDPLAAVAADRAKERQALSSQQADALANMTSVEKAKGSTKSTEPSWATKERAALDDILLKATANAKSMADLERSKAQATADFWDTASKQEGITQQQRLQAEAAANQARLTLTAMSVRTNVAGAKESLAAHLAELSAEQAGYRDDFAKWNEIEQRKLALIKAAYGEQSRQYQTELAREDVAHQGAIQRELAQTLDGIHKQAAARAGALEEKRAELNDRVALGQITIQQEIAQLRELTAASYKADEDELRSFAQSMGLRPAIVQKINEQIAALQLKASIADAKLQQQSTQQTIKEYGVGFNAIKAGFDTSINGIMQGTQTMSQAFARGAQTMVMSFARAAIDMAMTWAKQEAVMVIQHMTGEATKTAATAAGVATRVATQAAGAQAGAAIEKASTTPVIQSDAAKAAAGAYSALAGIPIIGPVIAPIAAGVAYAGVMAFGGGLAVGAYDVPQDMMAVIHQGEMVVPANFSQGIRSGAVTMGGPGGGGGNVGALNVTISAIDTQTGAAFLRAQLPTLAKQLAQHLNSNPSARPAY